MSDKSFVTLEQKVCLVCAKTFDTGSLLLDRRLGEKFDKYTVTGWDLCPEHQKLYDEGYIALVAADESKSDTLSNGNIKDPGGAYRTGELAHIRQSVWPHIFDSPLPTNNRGTPLPMVFCDQKVVELLQAKMKEAGL